MKIPPFVIISGGQTGADRGALDAAIACNIQHGGSCTHNALSEDGPINLQRYHLTRRPHISEFGAALKDRTVANVVNSQCTIVFVNEKLTPGTQFTINCVKHHKKPLLVICIPNRSREKHLYEIVDFISIQWKQFQSTSSFIINVAGSRESKAPGIHDWVRDIMKEVLLTFCT